MVHDRRDVIEISGQDEVSLCLDQLLKASGLKLRKNGGTGSDNAAYGGIGSNYVDTSLKLYCFEYPCHAKILELKTPKILYNRFTRRDGLSEEARKNYLSWLLSEESPWKTFKNRSLTEVPKDFEGDGFDFILQHGWVWTDLSAPSNLQHSFLTAGRMAAEWPKLISKWNSWQFRGLNKGLCFVFQDVFHPVSGRRTEGNRQYWKINRSNLYDWPLDVCTADETYVKNFCQGVVDDKVLNKPYSEDSTYTPVNRIFGDNSLTIYDSRVSRKEVERYPDTIFRLYSKYYGQNEAESREYWKAKMGWAAFKYSDFWSVTEEEIIKIIQLETERLGLHSDSTDTKTASSNLLA